MYFNLLAKTFDVYSTCIKYIYFITLIVVYCICVLARGIREKVPLGTLIHVNLSGLGKRKIPFSGKIKDKIWEIGESRETNAGQQVMVKI